MSASSNKKLKDDIRKILLQHENHDCPSEISDVSNQDAIEKLAAGLMSFYEPELKRFREQLAEVVNKQNSLIEQMQDENKRFEAQNGEELQNMFAMVKAYQAKLTVVKKEMTSLHDRATKMKKRALKLQQRKEKQALLRKQQREMELQREQDLIRRQKPAKSPAKTVSPDESSSPS